MKKFILALATVTIVGLGGSAASAALTSQLPQGCAEPSDVPTDPCYDAQLYPIGTTTTTTIENGQVLPPGPAATTTIASASQAPGSLPRTGSGVSPILGIGVLLLVVGGIVVIASRRRSASTSAN